MIKVINCNNKNYISKLIKFLNSRRNEKNLDTKIVSKILKDVKKNKFKAVLKYEKKFSKNSETKLSKSKINKSIKKLNLNVKKAIDYAYLRILKFHSKQKKELKDIIYIDNLNNKLEYRCVPISSIGLYVPGNLP